MEVLGFVFLFWIIMNSYQHNMNISEGLAILFTVITLSIPAILGLSIYHINKRRKR